MDEVSTEVGGQPTSPAGERREKPFPVVLSGPSGVGKSTLARELRRSLAGSWISVSATTREPRADEVDGKDYLFLSSEEFQRRKKQDAFVEWASVHGHFYGTPREPLEKHLAKGRFPILDIDVQGGIQIRGSFPTAVLVFVLPPDLSVLEERLRGRRSDSESEVKKRLRNAAGEMDCLWDYDYLVVNRDIGQAVSQLVEIVHAETRRVTRLPRGVAWEQILGRRSAPRGRPRGRFDEQSNS